MGAPTAWNNYGLDGTGIGVAIIDSGIPDLNDFKDAGGKARIVYSNSAGTYGYGTIAAPGNDSYAITVGAGTLAAANYTFPAVDFVNGTAGTTEDGADRPGRRVQLSCRLARSRAPGAGRVSRRGWRAGHSSGCPRIRTG